MDEFIRTGQWQAQTQPAPEEPDNPYADPEVIELRKTLRELKDKLAQIKNEYDQRFSQTEVVNLQSGIEKNIDSVMSEYAVTDELRKEMSEEINRRVEAATRLAKQGDKQSLNMLSMLHGDNVKQTLERIIAPIALREMETIARARQTGKAKALASQSTGAPGRSATAANGDNGRVPFQARVVGDIVKQALEKRTKQAGYDPRTLWG